MMLDEWKIRKQCLGIIYEKEAFGHGRISYEVQTLGKDRFVYWFQHVTVIKLKMVFLLEILQNSKSYD